MSQKPRVLNWELKTAERDYWYLQATELETIESTKEPDFYETLWQIRVHTSPCSPEYVVAFQIRSQYNEEIGLDDIAREMHQHVMSLYDAAMQDVGVQIGRRCIPIKDDE